MLKNFFFMSLLGYDIEGSVRVSGDVGCSTRMATAVMGVAAGWDSSEVTSGGDSGLVSGSELGTNEIDAVLTGKEGTIAR